ncbi:hypothetical protein FQN57_006199 [Myotisia sp. PD_48]|nr:hypothetical protein FQN57_006199 [Myotisia sp. PD_48]
MLLTVKTSTQNGNLALDERPVPSFYSQVPNLSPRQQITSENNPRVASQSIRSPPRPSASYSIGPPHWPVAHPYSTPYSMDPSHRNLPPPMAMGLPSVAEMSPSSSRAFPPPPPTQWQDPDSMRQWLKAKAEEEKRKQEQERTHQETLKLDQRRIEHNMLREALDSRIPSHMVPLVFTSLAGPSNFQLAQQYISQLSQHPNSTRMPPSSASSSSSPPSAQHQHPRQDYPVTQHHHTHFPHVPLAQNHQHQQPTTPHTANSSKLMPPDPNAENREIAPNPYATSDGYPPGTGSLQQTPPSLSHSTSSSQLTSGHSQSATSTAPVYLPRISTSELQLQTSTPYNSGSATGPAVPARPNTHHKQDSNSAPQPSQTSPAISFHHWTPPNRSSPNTPAGKSPNNSPYPSHPSSHLKAEYQHSPKRRKTHRPSSSQSSDTNNTRVLHDRSTSKAGGGTKKRSEGGLRTRNEYTFKVVNGIGNTTKEIRSESSCHQPDFPRQSGQMQVSSLIRPSDPKRTGSNSREDPAADLDQRRKESNGTTTTDSGNTDGTASATIRASSIGVSSIESTHHDPSRSRAASNSMTPNNDVHLLVTSTFDGSYPDKDTTDAKGSRTN